MTSIAQGSTVALRQQVLARNRKRAKGTPKASTIAVYASIFALIAGVVAVGYQAPQDSSAVANAVTLNSDASNTSVNELVATNIAANLAETTDLAVAKNVANLSVSLTTKSELAQINDAVITKPQILQPTAESRTIVSYTTKAGDTVDALAAQYGVSKDTIKWANSLTSDALVPGKVLQILPVDGVQYQVKAGDTVQSIAQKYNVDQARVVLYNDLDEAGLTNGVKIILPSGNLPETERPGYRAPRVISSGFGTTGSSGGYNTSSASVGNRYAYGYCTWYVYERRAQMGMPIGSFWGDASNWANAARSAGYLVDHTPTPGAIMQNGGGAGHVAMIESVAPNGDVSISEMNNTAYGGWNVKSYRTMTGGQAAVYTFIH